MTIWLCPDCHQVLDGLEGIRVDFSQDHTGNRCAACNRPRLTVVPDPEDEQLDED